MNQTSRLSALFSLALIASAPALLAQQWIAPTAAELSMTSIPEVPGAPAVYLFKDQTADDGLHMESFYTRIKVLTEGGKEYANVELPYFGSAGRSIDAIAGRTIHPDGTVIPFSGKPYEKVIQKINGYQYKVKIFTLPAVEVGSILEYRYKIHLDDGWFHEPEWNVQSALFTRKAHYMWRPTDRLVTSENGKQVSSSVAWTPILPPGTTVKQHELLGTITRADAGHAELTLDVADIPPLPHEEFMPPLESISYRVRFYYTSFRTPVEYWTSQGKRWAHDWDKFIGPGPAVGAAVNGMIAPADTQEQKLRKFYTAVMALENTDFTREHSTSEEKAQGMKDINSSDDVWNRKRGSGDQLAELFVSMARAGGMKAYLMNVADRSRRLFLPNYLSGGQLDDFIAIVNVDGKEMMFDPGQRYCAFGHLAWKHTVTQGLRQTDGGTQIAATPSSNFKDAHVIRVADLTLDESGIATGTTTITYSGDPALRWRQQALRGDDTSLKTDLRVAMEELLPGGMEVSVTKVDNLTDPEKPLQVEYAIKGAIGSPTGKRLLVRANLFETNTKPIFAEAKRDLAIDMHYPSVVQDAVRFKLPSSLVVESVPTSQDATMTNVAAFRVSSKPGAGSITMYRNVTLGSIIYMPNDYTEFRNFYGKLQAKDQETLVLTHSAAPTSSGGGN